MPGEVLRTKKKLSVLIVEDDRDIITILDALLKEAEHEVACADGASEALRILDGNGPDVVLLDCHLPGGGMGEILTKADIAGSDVVLMSGDSALLAQFSAFGYSCLHKPFSFGALIAAIDACLN